MSTGAVSHSPQRGGRSRLSELLKSAPVESRTLSSKPQALAPGRPVEAVEAPSWPLVSNNRANPATNILATGKNSKENSIEVVVGTSPMRQANGSWKEEGVGELNRAYKRLSRAESAKSPVVVSERPVSSHAKTPEVIKKPTTGVQDSSGLHRSASDVNLPDVRHRSDTITSQASQPSIRSAMSETGLATMSATELERPKATASISKETKISRRQSITNRLRGRSKPGPIPIDLKPPHELTELPKAILSPREQITDPMEDKPSALTKIARRSSWIIGSRSPSPSNRKLLQQKRSNENKAGDAGRSGARTTSATSFARSSSSPNVSLQNGPQLAESTAAKKSRRPLSAIVSRSNSFSGGLTPKLHLPKSASAEQLPETTATDEVPEMPKIASKAKFQAANTNIPRKKDELWTNFRTLDADHQKFISKPSSLKAQVIRSGLLPFLKNFSDHPSTKTLRAEDVDRRVNILNKWWTSLLEILNGRNGQSVSPNDRPVVLEAIYSIMIRPEWRLSLSTISGRSPPRTLANSRSVSSLESTSSDFLAESVIHNVRNVFVQNLLSQMAFVVERMSMRSVPASIVDFCGKACAYAFLFCPGVAEILVRLWSPPPDAIKRVMKEAGALEKGFDPSFAVDVLSHAFPAHLQPLTVTSFPTLMRYLRSKPRDNIPLSSAYISWNGPWVGRWCGRDSDLFFVFAKTATALICELLPETTSPADWICVPCAALIQAQLLYVMDATIHRGSSNEASDGLPSPTFDDVLGADAVVQPLPRAPNTTRIMAENRLIILLRECLFSESYRVKPHVRRTFAQVYINLLKSATRRVSLYDHNAYFTLCDFLDEAFHMLARYYKSDENPAGWVDWPFWFDVLKKMGDTNNTMSEVRLYTFVYSLWGLLTQEREMKRQLCLDWLLREDYFERQFNHWCPMVRAYYMRLVIWRLAREDGDRNRTDCTIYQTLFDRLNRVWGWYLTSQAEARENGKTLLSSAPATPAPGRRLLIVRHDNGPLSSGQQSWDSMMAAASSSGQPNTYQRYSSLNPVMQAAEKHNQDTSARSPSPAKKGWLRRFSLFGPTISSTSPESPDPDNSGSQREVVKPNEADSPASKRLSTIPGSLPIGDGKEDSSTGAREPPRVRPHAKLSFKFSLEWVDRSTLVPRDRKLSPPQLPQLAQQLVDGSLADAGNANRAIQVPKPVGEEVGLSRYCGRSLAEWEMLTKECHGFYERRRAEGVSDIRWMETPTLGFEGFKRPVG